MKTKHWLFIGGILAVAGIYCYLRRALHGLDILTNKDCEELFL